MCDIDRYCRLYEEIMRLQPEDTLQLILEAKTKEERDFFTLIGDFLLQNRQRQVVERNLF